MKEHIWKILVLAIRIVPLNVRRQLCRLMFDASSLEESATACRDLLILEESLNWYINKAALRYGKGEHPKHRLMGYHRFFTERMNSDESVLDVGCGYGALANSMSKTGATVTGIDINTKNIEQARKYYQREKLSFVEGDVCQMVFDRRYDTIVLSNVLEHIHDRSGLLKRLLTTCHPGRFLIRVPLLERSWKVYFRRELGMFHFSDPTHHVEYTVDSFSKEMQEAGLRAVSLESRWGELYAELRPFGIGDAHNV